MQLTILTDFISQDTQQRTLIFATKVSGLIHKYLVTVFMNQTTKCKEIKNGILRRLKHPC